MSVSRPWEQVVLHEAGSLVARQAYETDSPDHARLELLEALASLAGGWRLADFRERHPDNYVLDPEASLGIASELQAIVDKANVPIPLALASLARPELEQTDRRKAGVYYTDFRLAQYVANQLVRPLARTDRIIDPAAGTGILLAAVGLMVATSGPGVAGHFVAEQASAADLTVEALRGTRLALASMTDSLDAVDALDSRLRIGDSLMTGREWWKDVAPDGFDVVVGNPPWEKLKASRHEYLKAAGDERHYGDDTESDDDLVRGVGAERAELSDYAEAIANRYPVQAQGEPDLYKAFTALSLELTRADGQIGLLLPAGLIRSEGTEALRRLVFARAAELRITVLENRARFFAIDTRFKFLAVHAAVRPAKTFKPVELLHGSGTPDGVLVTSAARIGRGKLAQVRDDLTVPEVRGATEWKLFTRMHAAGPAFGSPQSWWCPSLMREVDMTRDRPLFTRSPGVGSVAVVEGRMVHQYRIGVKSYQSGTGRRAVWTANGPGHSRIEPQFWMPRDAIPLSARERLDRIRVGFCDITGQTNERSMLASLIPPGVICGNKVPTIAFGVDDAAQYDATLLWLAIANSIPFDWFLRRIITTTVNYFLLLSVPFPESLTPDSVPGRRLINLARRIVEADSAGGAFDPRVIAQLRAEIDVQVGAAYSLGLTDLVTILKDFPLLDRGQPTCDHEIRSTATADLILLEAGKVTGPPNAGQAARCAAQTRVGALAYVPADFQALTRDFAESPAAQQA